MPNQRKHPRPKTFRLIRTEDISGVSGVGEVAEGVVFHDGQTVISWFGKFHSLGLSPTIEEVAAIHGHGGRTKIIWDDEDE